MNLTKRFSLFLLLLILSCFGGALPTQAADDWHILAFNSAIAIQSTGQVKVVETISADFGATAKHGIFRDLPLVYEDANGQKTYTTIQVTSVQRNGQAEPYTVSHSSANLRIKIGDEDRTLEGSQTYVITYTATGILRSFDNYDELYWNVTGNEWEVPLGQVSATVTLPAKSITQTACYEGSQNSTTPCQFNQIDAQNVEFRTSRTLYESEGLTVAVGYTKGVVPILMVAPPKTFEDVVANRLTWIVAILSTLIGVTLVIRRWWQRGRDPQVSRNTIVAEYEPPHGLRPAEVGTLIDQKADTKDISATIVDLAVRGYLTIEELAKKGWFGKIDYQFKRTAKTAETLLKYEQELLDRLFKDGDTVKISDLKESFYKDLEAIKKMVYEDVIEKKLFVANPNKVRQRNAGLAIGILVIGGGLIAIGVRFLQELPFGLGLGLLITGLLAMSLAKFMPKRTMAGQEALRHIEGYKLFLTTTEKHRQPFFEKQNIFMEILPYAMVFGVTKKLVKSLQDMGIQPPQPTWYIGHGPFSFVAFDQQLNILNDSLSTAMASMPHSSGSGGGGSSGGGFGGGGGGSW